LFDRSICTFLGSHPTQVEVSNNAAGCNTTGEIEENCFENLDTTICFGDGINFYGDSIFESGVYEADIYDAVAILKKA
jgi:hypothetical protein